MIAPDAPPLQFEPWSKPRAAAPGQLHLQCLRADPARGQNFAAVDTERLAASADEYRADLMLGADRLELRLIMKLEQEIQRTAHTELFPQTPLYGLLHRLRAPRVTAAAVRPEQRPQRLAGRTLLQQQLPVRIEYQHREGPM